MKPTDKIEWVDPQLIHPHPLNNQLYGDENHKLEPAFVDSIKRNGIEQPIIIFELDDTLYTNSGHRRRQAALLLKMKKVPCLRREYANIEEAEPDLMSMNVHRHKTEDMLAREAEHWMEVLGREAEQRMKAGKPLSDIRQGSRTDDEVADKLGLSRNRVHDLIVVFGDDYRSNFIDSLRRVEFDHNLDAVLLSWDQIRRQRLDDEISLSRAMKDVKHLMEAVSSVQKESKPRLAARSLSPLKLMFQELNAEDEPEYLHKYDLENGSLWFGAAGGNPCLIFGRKVAVLPESFFTQFEPQLQEV